jgi:hypothetical protein
MELSSTIQGPEALLLLYKEIPFRAGPNQHSLRAMSNAEKAGRVAPDTNTHEGRKQF